MENRRILKKALEIMKSRNALCSANTSFGADTDVFVSEYFHLSLWAWTGMCTGKVCFCSEVVLISGARGTGRTINRGKFLLTFSWEDISEKAGLNRAKSSSLFLGFFKSVLFVVCWA